MGTRPFKKPDKERHDEVIFIGRARSPKYDYRPYIQRAFTQGNIECLQSIQKALYDMQRFSNDADMSFLGMQINVAQDCIDKIRKQYQRPLEMHVENYNNNFNMNNNMSADEQAEILRSFNQGAQIGQQNNVFGGTNTLNYNEKGGEEKHPFMDVTEVDDAVAEEKPSTEPANDNSPFVDKDERIRFAIKVVQNDPNFNFNGDWAWIKKAMEDEPINEVRSAERFKEYISGLGAIRIPTRQALNLNLAKIGKKVNGYYQFTDTSDHDEIVRRNNIMKEFVAAFNKYKK